MSNTKSVFMVLQGKEESKDQESSKTPDPGHHTGK